MAIYSSFFLCKPEELPGGFPGWKLPLAESVHREFRNPFTGQVTIIETREPEWSEGDEEPSDAWNNVGLPKKRWWQRRTYEDHLEVRLRGFVRSCPHWASKGLTEIEMGPLCEAAGLRPDFLNPIHAPPSTGAAVQQLPSGLLAMLCSLDRNALAQQWAAAMSTPERTHSASGAKLSDGWTAPIALEILKPLIALARQSTPDQQLYLIMEW